MRLLQDQIMHLSQVMDKKLSTSNKILHDSVSSNFATTSKIAEKSNKYIEDLTKKVSQFEETNKQIQDIWGQLEWLEKILKNPKQRGILGEYFLENVLKNILPPDNFSLQYSFSNGEAVDGVIFVKDKIIPIDSKFSLDNYNKIIESESKVEKEIFFM